MQTKTSITAEIENAIARSISHNEIVTVEVEDIDEATSEVNAIADECEWVSGVEQGSVTGTDIWGALNGDDFRLFIRK